MSVFKKPKYNKKQYSVCMIKGSDITNFIVKNIWKLQFILL
ncbi:hypothetical protein CTDIVETGP_0953 [Clostridium tyrobutyricum DIVETGP]|uniref:Uncharacterized protein n=1 Tax=Clostridium tyrobutyricum DIVETGP TaxID=1408889 RepID=W6N364_CLOTY|nr:hypothetical protein CTK_C27550 [Clostridium tyrobutyricum]CDL90883.1 hypothetical protein CTDIVETGP_0953 [Clostridium tyrobutyricum DIVETGP]